ncbi:MAG: alcohol dehydrogenase catalytic domain-containing protein, partial [Candidatus Binatia bacterium]|nr:alcohol dehydrogenase catalytic domain-containing protein [Candidatus Binatia bacterium]
NLEKLAAQASSKNILEEEPFDFSDLSAIRYTDLPKPEIPSEEWVRIKTSMSGICGSDLGFIAGKVFPSMEPFSSLPFVPGHEMCGVVDQIGKEEKEFQVGDRVAIDPTLACRQRVIHPPCPPCARGDFSLCENIDRGAVGPGILQGVNAVTGGGWGEYFIAHRSQLLKLPDHVSDEEGFLLEPFSVSLHGVLRNRPQSEHRCLIFGCGTIGLTTIAALKGLELGGQVIAVAKYPHQAKAARLLGADEVILPGEDDLYGRVAGLTGGRLFPLSTGKHWLEGGIDLVYDSVGNSATLDDSLRLLRAGGKLVLLGAPAFAPKVEWVPFWFREIQLVGSICYGMEEWKGKAMTTFEVALELVQKDKVNLKPLVTHHFPIDRYERAIRVAGSKSLEEVVKVAFCHTL